MVLDTLPRVIRNPLDQVFFALRDTVRCVLQGAALLGIFSGVAFASSGLFVGVDPWIPWVVLGLSFGLSFFFFLYSRRHGFGALVYWVLCGVCGALCMHALVSVSAPLSGGVLYTLFSAERLLPFACLGLVISAVLLWWKYDTGLPEREALRGRGQSQSADAHAYHRKTLKRYKKGVPWGGTILPYPLETEQFVITGTAGSGKSALLKTLLKAVILRIGLAAFPNNQLFMVDPKRDMYPLACYWIAEAHPEEDPEKRVRYLYPFDARACWIDFQADMKTRADCDLLAEMLILEGGPNADPIWTLAPRQLLSAVAEALMTSGLPWDLRVLLKICENIHHIQQVISHWLPENRVADLLNMGRTTQGFQAQLVTSVNSYRGIAALYDSLKRQGRPSVCIRDFVGSEQVWLLGNDPEKEASLSPITRYIAERVCTSIRASIPAPGTDPRHWFVLEEAVSIGKLSIGKLFDDGRSKGAAGVLCFQNVYGMYEVYGENTTNKLLDLCSNKAILRADAKAAEAASDIFGSAEVYQTTHTQSEKDSSQITYAHQKVVEAAELRDLPHMLEGKIGGYFSSALVRNPWLHFFKRSYFEREVFGPERKAHERFPAFIPHTDPQAEILRPWTDEEKSRFGLEDPPPPKRSPEKSVAALRAGPQPKQNKDGGTGLFNNV